MQRKTIWDDKNVYTGCVESIYVSVVKPLLCTIKNGHVGKVFGVIICHNISKGRPLFTGRSIIL